MLKPYLKTALQGSLSYSQAQEALSLIIDGADPMQVASLISIMKTRGETADELAGMLHAMDHPCATVSLPGPILNMVGTGGDMANTVNLTTAAALLTAACGVRIAKHGSRASSSRCGSADVLEALGIDLLSSEPYLNHCIEDFNICFIFTPEYYPALEKIAPLRKTLGIPTLFNLLGPLLNPCTIDYTLIGVATEKQLSLYAQTLAEYGSYQRALVFHGAGLDEITTVGKIQGYDIAAGEIKSFEIDPLQYGFSHCSVDDLKGGDMQDNARILYEVCSGKMGPIADSLILTAGTASFMTGNSPSIEAGLELADNTLREGQVRDLIDRWRSYEILS